jgi:hypothetical protein
MKPEDAKKNWIRNWTWEINAQRHTDFLVGRKGKTSKEFKLFVKNFLKKKKKK